MKHTKYLSIAVLITLFCQAIIAQNDYINGDQLLKKMIEKADPNHQWPETTLKVHIQEPRVGNPQRHTKLTLKNAESYFAMERFRVDGIVSRSLSADGTSEIALDGIVDLPDSIIQKYKLNVQRTINHKRFYELMYGLPMTLNKSLWQNINPARRSQFEGKEVYEISIELKEEMISKFWTLIIGVNLYKLLAIEFSHPDETDGEEEIIKFEGEIKIANVVLPRIRNWYIKGSNEYLGSDIIVSELQ